MTARFEISSPTLADIDDIDACNRKCLPENYPKAFYQQFIMHPNSFVFVTRDKQALQPVLSERKENKEQKEIFETKGKLVGYIISAMILDNKKKPVNYIYSIAVLPEYQKKFKIGTALMNCNEHIVRTHRQPTKTTLHVRRKSAGAQKFYSKLDFARTKLVKKYYNVKPRDDAWFMSKPQTYTEEELKTYREEREKAMEAQREAQKTAKEALKADAEPSNGTKVCSEAEKIDDEERATNSNSESVNSIQNTPNTKELGEEKQQAENDQKQ